MEKPHVNGWPDEYIAGAKRAHIRLSGIEGWDWFVGYGKDESCQFEGTWWDMICFARNILASVNTSIVAPAFYKPEWGNNNYTGPKPYTFEGEEP